MKTTCFRCSRCCQGRDRVSLDIIGNFAHADVSALHQLYKEVGTSIGIFLRENSSFSNARIIRGDKSSTVKYPSRRVPITTCVSNAHVYVSVI